MPEPALAFVRRSAEQALLVAFNLGSEPCAIELPDELALGAGEERARARSRLQGRVLHLAGHGSFFQDLLPPVQRGAQREPVAQIHSA